MGSRSATTLTVLTVLVSFCCLLPQGMSSNYGLTYQLLDHLDGSTYYNLHVTVSESLHEYYAEKSHMLTSNDDFAKFVTPYALKPVADGLWKIYTDDEDFANGVLMIVHQIPYEESKPAKYPVETIVDDKGDCDLFSYIAASIMKAGGLNVVLFYYENEAHMNLGVNLSHEPRDTGKPTDFVLHDGIRFYVAECTGGNWQTGWRVGECPDSLKDASVQVITLENCDQSAPGQVSASYKTLEPCSISLDLSSAFLKEGSSIALSGRLSPALQNSTITIYIKINSSPWEVLTTAATDPSGQFASVWSAQASGICYFRASWPGNDDYTGADSPTRSLTILPQFFVLLLVMTVLLAGTGVVVFLMSRHSHQGTLEPQPPEIPS